MAPRAKLLIGPPNLLERDFTADRPNQKWAGDISYIWTREGWLYLAVILDLHSRRVIGWAVSDRMKRDLAIRALKMAIALRSPPPGCIFHSDRGSQYCVTIRRVPHLFDLHAALGAMFCCFFQFQGSNS
jgi:transposase InsO family protein